MESVGLLAGGVAHDFNNKLTVILGYTEMILEQMAPTEPLFADLQEIKSAAGHSAGLTRQLLAFARKQVVVPRVLDMNEGVEGMLNMLRRLIGEDIDLAWQPRPIVAGQGRSVADRPDPRQSLRQCQGCHCRCLENDGRNGEMHS